MINTTGFIILSVITLISLFMAEMNEAMLLSYWAGFWCFTTGFYAFLLGFKVWDSSK